MIILCLVIQQALMLLTEAFFGQYDISKHMNVTYSRSYDMSKDPKDWYGLEYKISF